MVTIQDVARRAGVPEKTAARALAGLTMGKRRDARERAERVLKAAAELGYQPSNIARALRQGKTKTLGLITGRLTNLYFAAVAEVAMDEAARAGYRLLIEISRWEAERTYHCVKDFLSYRVDGLLFTSSVPAENGHFYKLLADRHFPLVALLPGTLNFTSVYSDYTETFPRASRSVSATSPAVSTSRRRAPTTSSIPPPSLGTAIPIPPPLAPPGASRARRPLRAWCSTGRRAGLSGSRR